jgi:hypothetical protein
MVIELMNVGFYYKIRTKEGINFTGQVNDRTEKSIEFITIRKEKLIFDDAHLDWAKEIEKPEVFR